MRPSEFRAFEYRQQDWDTNPRWLFDAYRKVAFEQEKGLKDPKALERFIKGAIRNDKLTDPATIGIATDDKIGLVVTSGPDAEVVIKPFMPLIEAVTDEVLELVKVFGRDFLGMKTAEASEEIHGEIKRQSAKEGVDLGVSDLEIDRSGGGEEWALYKLRNELRNTVAAVMFKSIKDYAVAEHLHREHHMSDDVYQQMVDSIAERLDKTGMNGLARFVQANPGIEEKLETDERKLVPEQYKIRYKEDGKETGELSEWCPNDREKRRIERRELYQLHLDELEGKRANPSPHGNWNYDDALLTAQYQTIGPDYCAAVKKRNEVMGSYELGDGGQSTAQERLHYASNLGYDLSNEELQKLMREGTKDLSPERAGVIYVVNNLLGERDPRTEEYVRKAQTGAAPDPSSVLFPAPQREPEKDPSRLLTADDAAQPKKKGPSRGERDAASGRSSTDSRERSQGRDSPKEKEPDQKTSSEDDKSKHDGYVTAGKIGSTAVLGTVLGASILSMTKGPDKNTGDTSSGKSQTNKRFIAAVAALAAAAGIVVVWKYPDAVFGWLKKSGRSV